MNTFSRWIIIIISVLAVAGYYNYDELRHKKPQSYHHWRQSDCASLTQNFHEQNLPFWKPEIHALVADSGTTGKNAPSELAVYYWSVAQLYDVFDGEAAILRSINTLLFLTGIAAFIWCLFIVTENLWWSLLSGLILFTSPVLVYYGNNFLTNAPSFGMALAALAFVAAFVKTGLKKYWWWAVLFFLLAGALKLPGLFLFFAIGAVVFLHPRSFPLPKRDFLISAVLILLPIGAWVLYARHYNQLHHTTYFSTTIFPVWEYSLQDIRLMFSGMWEAWWGEYFHPATTIAFALLFLFSLLAKRSLHWPYGLLTIYLVAELFIFFILQYFTFLYHDYYAINMFMLAALLLVSASKIVKGSRPRLLSSPVSLIVLGIFLAGNIYYAGERLDFRYEEYPNALAKEHPQLYDSAPQWLEEIGVTKEDTIIFMEDDSHTSLYLLDRYGWTTHRMEFKDTALRITFNRSPEQVQRSIDNGAEYLVIQGLQTLYEKTWLHPFLRHLQGRKDELFVFNLRDTSRNFTLPKRQLINQVHFDFEDSVSHGFISRESIVEDSTAVSGSHVALAKEGEEYLGRYVLDSLTSGMLVEVLVWTRTGSEERVLPVIAEEDPFNFAEATNVVERKGSWKRYKQELLIAERETPGSAKIFFWNPAGVPAYFDDLQINIYAPDMLSMPGSSP